MVSASSGAEPPARTAAAATPAELPGGAARAVDTGGGRKLLVRELKGPGGLVLLCDALRDVETVTFDGNEVEQEKARDEYQRRRTLAMQDAFQVLVPGGGFGFRGYDMEEKRLELDTGRNFVLAQGVELVASTRETPLPLALELKAAEALLKQHEQAQLALRLVFRPAPSELNRDGCVRLSGGGVVKLPVNVLAFTLVGRDGKTVARGETADANSATPVVTPEVNVGRPRNMSDGRDAAASVASATQALGPAILPCYKKALEARPNLRGTLVLDVRVGGDGRIDAPRMEMSSLGDDALVACAVARAKATKLSGGGGARVSLPLTFGAKEDR